MRFNRTWFPVCREPNRYAMLMFMLDGVLINIAYFLSTGFLLNGYLIQIGASDFLVALLGNATNFSNILCLFSFLIFERFARRKKLLLGMNLLSRTLIASILIPPLIFGRSPATYAVVGLLIIVADMIWAIYRVGWLVWMMNIVPVDLQSRYVYQRNFLVRLFGLMAMVAAGWLIDLRNKDMTAFAVVILVSYLFSLADVAVLRRIDEHPYPQPQKDAVDAAGGRMLWIPLQNRLYRRLLIFIGSFALIQSMAVSSTQLFLLKYLAFDYTFVSLINSVASIVMLLSNPVWERADRRFAFRYVALAATLASALELALFSQARQDAAWQMLVIAVISGFAFVGINTAVFTYRYRIMSVHARTLFEGWYFFALGCGMLAGPLAGRFFVSRMPQWLAVTDPTAQLRLLFLVCAAGLLLLTPFAIFRLREQ